MTATLTLKTQSVYTNKYSFVTSDISGFVADVTRDDLIASCLEGGPLWEMFTQADDSTKWAALNYRFDFTVQVTLVGAQVPVEVNFLDASGLKMRVSSGLTGADAAIAIRFEHSMVN
jgi:hypothetical protein